MWVVLQRMAWNGMGRAIGRLEGVESREGRVG